MRIDVSAKGRKDSLSVADALNCEGKEREPMYLRIGLLGVCLVWLAMCTVAHGLDYLEEEGLPGTLWLAPGVYTGHLYGPVGDGEETSSWHIAQWGIRYDLPLQPTCLG